MSALVLISGMLVGYGLLLVATRGNPASHATPRPKARLVPSGRWALLAATGALAAMLVAVATHWPVAAIASGIGAVAGLRSLFSKNPGADEIARIEGLAGWAEQLRDTLVAGRGITETIRSTADVCPIAIRPSVQTLARQIHHQRLDLALRSWTDELDDPTADLIASVLLITATRAGRDVGRLLGAMAEVARDRVALRLRTDARRASTRTEARSLVGFSLGFFALLTMFGGSFMDPYSGLTGQFVLAIVVALVTMALLWLGRLGRYERAPRVLRGIGSPS